MSTSENRQVVAILVIGQKPMFKLGQVFDKRNLYMKFGSNRVINERVHKCKLTTGGGHFGGHLGYRSSD